LFPQASKGALKNISKIKLAKQTLDLNMTPSQPNVTGMISSHTINFGVQNSGLTNFTQTQTQKLQASKSQPRLSSIEEEDGEKDYGTGLLPEIKSLTNS